MEDSLRKRKHTQGVSEFKQRSSTQTYAANFNDFGDAFLRVMVMSVKSKCREAISADLGFFRRHFVVFRGLTVGDEEAAGERKEGI